MSSLEYKEVFKEVSKLLKSATPEHTTETKILLNHFKLNQEQKISSKTLKRLNSVLKHRIRGIPLNYLLKTKLFDDKAFTINDHVLIPRTDTELLLKYIIRTSDFVIDQQSRSEEINFLEIGVGSGVLIISLINNLVNKKRLDATASDISQKALEISIENGLRLLPWLKLKKDTASCEISGSNFNLKLKRSDVYNNLEPKKYDIVFSNPPYISEVEFEELQKEVKNEPRIALISGEDGLDIYRKIVDKLGQFLSSDGIFLGEINPKFSDKLSALFKANSYSSIFKQGFAKEKRFIIASKNQKLLASLSDFNL